MADRNLTLAMRVTADTKEGRAALAQLQQAMRQTGSAGSGALDPFTQSVARATGGASELRTQLKPLQSLLAFAGVSVGVRELITLADTYSQMTARLRLATQYTGDFAEVQKLLEQAALDTRAPLTSTVDLYTKLSPALQNMGRNAAQSVGVITTINQAVALSGSSAESANAAIIQLGQGFASGTLRGEELNSIMEQTPALAKAIADGLGVPVGALRKMGEAGELTAERVVAALEKVAGRVGDSFNSLPLTVGQALTKLQNQLLKVVGTADQGSGAVASLARAIVFVAEGISAFAGAGETLRPFVEFVVNAIDGVSRLFRIVATGLAGYTLAIQQALSGDLSGALATYRSIGEEVQRILDEPLADQQRAKEAAQISATDRLKVEEDLAKEIQKLEKLRKVAAGQANADILLDDQQTQKKRIEEARKATNEQIKGTEALREALRTAWNGAIEGARKAREESAALFAQAADARVSGADKAAERRNQGLSAEEKSAIAERDAATARDASASAAARAVIKTYEGDLAGAQKMAAEAAKQAERAEQFANAITDDNTAADLLDELGKIRAQAIEAQARIKQQEAKAGEESARAMQDQILAAETRITALKAELAKPLTIQLDITAAEAQIKRLQEQLAKIDGKTIVAGQPTQSDVRRVDNATAGDLDKTATVTADTAKADAALAEVKTAVDAIPAEKTVVIKTVNAADGSFSASDAASAWNASQPGFAGGGHIRGPGTATSDSILARLSDGEYVVRAAAVRRYGLNFLHALNGMSLPKFATGGLVASAMAPALADARSSRDLVGRDIVLPGGERFRAYTDSDQEAQISSILQRLALQMGRRG